MLSDTRIREAESNVRSYLEEGLLVRRSNQAAQEMYLHNSDVSLATAHKVLSLESPSYKPYLWVVVPAYYAMYYIANAVLLAKGYKVGDRISHKVASDTLIALLRSDIRKGLLKGYEETREDALDLTAARTDDLLQSFDHERTKRSRFQYRMDAQTERSKALTSLERAKTFVFEMKKLL